MDAPAPPADDEDEDDDEEGAEGASPQRGAKPAMRPEQVEDAVIRIQAIVRCRQSRAQYVRLRNSVLTLQSAFSKSKVRSL